MRRRLHIQILEGQTDHLLIDCAIDLHEIEGLEFDIEPEIIQTVVKCWAIALRIQQPDRIQAGRLQVSLPEPNLYEQLEISPDLLVLSTAFRKRRSCFT